MTTRPAIALRVDERVERVVARRIEFAFGLYCVLAGLRPVAPSRADLVVRYGLVVCKVEARLFCVDQ